MRSGNIHFQLLDDIFVFKIKAALNSFIEHAQY